MTLKLELEQLLAYSDWERAQWYSWFREHGPGALAVDLGPNRDGRINTVGELVRHIFSAESRYIERIRRVPLSDAAAVPADDVEAVFAFGRRSREALRSLLATFAPEGWDVPQEIQIGKHSRSVTPRKMILQSVTHEIRHWAQVATFLRLNGWKPGPRDFLASPVLDRRDRAPDQPAA